MSEETHCSQYEPPRQITSWPHCHSPIPSSFLFPPTDNRDHSRPHRIIIFFFFIGQTATDSTSLQSWCWVRAQLALSGISRSVHLPLSPLPSLCSTHFSIYLMNFGFSRGTFHYYSWFIRALLYRTLRIAAQKCANCIWIILPLGLFNKHEVNNG